MQLKSEQMVLGVIVLILGMFLVFSGFNIASTSFTGAGLGLILLYKTKKKSWALILGCFFILAGSLSIIGSRLIWNIFPLVTGICFLSIFYEKNRKGLLIPGVLLIGFSVKNILAMLLPVVHSNIGWISMLVYSVSFYAIYKLGGYFLGKWPKYVSAVLLILAIVGAIR